MGLLKAHLIWFVEAMGRIGRVRDVPRTLNRDVGIYLVQQSVFHCFGLRACPPYLSKSTLSVWISRRIDLSGNVHSVAA